VFDVGLVELEPVAADVNGSGPVGELVVVLLLLITSVRWW
jgi:hypothetical protein